MKAIVLCGGLGTRLGELTKHAPKSMLQVAGRPFIAHVLDRLCFSGIEGIVLAAGFAWEQLKSYVGDYWANVPIHYSVDPFPLGTGGAILLAMQSHQLTEALVVNGDTLFEIDLRLFLNDSSTQKRASASTLIALKTVENCSRYGRVEIDHEGVVQSFGEKNFCGPGFINGGIYVQRRSPLERLGNLSFSFEADYLANNFKSLEMIGIPSNGYFIDIGVPEDLIRADLEQTSFSRNSI